MNILAIISVLFFSIIIIMTVLSMIADYRRNKAYNEYFERKKQEHDAWMQEHEF